MIEAVGLWLRKTWAQWFAILTGGMYIPLELFEVTRSATWPRVTVLVVNMGGCDLPAVRTDQEWLEGSIIKFGIRITSLIKRIAAKV